MHIKTNYKIVMGLDNYFEEKEAINTLYVVFYLVKHSFSDVRIPNRTRLYNDLFYRTLKHASYFYLDNFNVNEFTRYLHSPGYSTREKILFTKNDRFIVKHLTFLFLIPPSIFFPNTTQKLLVKEVIKIMLYLKLNKNEEKQVFDFFTLVNASLSRIRVFKYFYNIIKGRSSFFYGSINNRDQSISDFLFEFFIDYLMEKEPLTFSIAELENKLIETQKDLKAYMMHKGLLEFRYQKGFYFT